MRSECRTRTCMTKSTVKKESVHSDGTHAHAHTHTASFQTWTAAHLRVSSGLELLPHALNMHVALKAASAGGCLLIDSWGGRGWLPASVKWERDCAKEGLTAGPEEKAECTVVGTDGLVAVKNGTGARVVSIFPLPPLPPPFFFHILRLSLPLSLSLSLLLSLSRSLSLFLPQYVCGCPCACMQTYRSVSKTPVPMRAHTAPMQVIGALWPTRRRRATL